MTPQERWLALLAAERDRRDPRRGEDARQRLLDQLEQMAATAHLHPNKTDDMSIAEMFACRWFLPEELMPPGLGTEAEIWSLYQTRKSLPLA